MVAVSPRKRPGPASWRTYLDAASALPKKQLKQSKTPTESWWLTPMTREQFQARARQLDSGSQNAIHRSPGGYRD